MRRAANQEGVTETTSLAARPACALDLAPVAVHPRAERGGRKGQGTGSLGVGLGRAAGTLRERGDRSAGGWAIAASPAGRTRGASAAGSPESTGGTATAAGDLGLSRRGAARRRRILLRRRLEPLDVASAPGIDARAVRRRQRSRARGGSLRGAWAASSAAEAPRPTRTRGPCFGGGRVLARAAARSVSATAGARSWSRARRAVGPEPTGRRERVRSPSAWPGRRTAAAPTIEARPADRAPAGWILAGAAAREPAPASRGASTADARASAGRAVVARWAEARPPPSKKSRLLTVPSTGTRGDRRIDSAAARSSSCTRGFETRSRANGSALRVSPAALKACAARRTASGKSFMASASSSTRGERWPSATLSLAAARVARADKAFRARGHVRPRVLPAAAVRRRDPPAPGAAPLPTSRRRRADHVKGARAHSALARCAGAALAPPPARTSRCARSPAPGPPRARSPPSVVLRRRRGLLRQVAEEPAEPPPGRCLPRAAAAVLLAEPELISVCPSVLRTTGVSPRTSERRSARDAALRKRAGCPGDPGIVR